MSADRKPFLVISDPNQINFPVVASVDKTNQLDDAVLELRSQILLKSKVPDIIAGRLVDGKGCGGILYRMSSNPDRLKQIIDCTENNDFLTGFARIYYPISVLSNNQVEMEHTGRYILGASFCKYAERKSELIRQTLTDKSIVSNSESKRMELQYSFYNSIDILGTQLLRDVVRYQPEDHAIVNNVEGHFAKFEKNEDNIDILVEELQDDMETELRK